MTKQQFKKLFDEKFSTNHITPVVIRNTPTQEIVDFIYKEIIPEILKTRPVDDYKIDANGVWFKSII